MGSEKRKVVSNNGDGESEYESESESESEYDYEYMNPNPAWPGASWALFAYDNLRANSDRVDW